jgi:asparagine synthase (glutamine-hydrolysing)
MRVRYAIALLRIGLIDPRLMRLAWRLARGGKTYLTYPTLHSLARSFYLMRARRHQPIQIAEFGVGRGGSAILFGWLIGQHGGNLTLYDVFGRIPPPTQKDGARAQERYQVILTKESPQYYGNIPNLQQVVLDELSAVCRRDQVEIVEGRYEELLEHPQDKRAFDLVHIDCDWYESYKAVLAYLQGKISPGAILQMDDYSNWQGSKAAVDEVNWLSRFQRRLVDGALVIDTGLAMER